MRVLTIVAAACLACTHVLAAQAAAVADEHKKLQDYVGSSRTNHSTVLIAQCKIREGSKAIIILPVGSLTGRFIEIVDTPVAGNQTARIPVNRGGLRVRNGKWSNTIDFGGVQTLRYMTNVIDNLLKSDFRMLPPTDLGLIVTSEPKVDCPSS